MIFLLKPPVYLRNSNTFLIHNLSNTTDITQHETLIQLQHLKLPNCSNDIFVKATCILAKFKYLSYSQFVQHDRHNATRNTDTTSTPKLLESVLFPLKKSKTEKHKGGNVRVYMNKGVHLMEPWLTPPPPPQKTNRKPGVISIKRSKQRRKKIE